MKSFDTDTPSLEDLLERSVLERDPETFRAFLSEFLSAELIVADRHQASSMSNSPRYPDDFFHILGVQMDDRVVVPIFTSEHHLSDWAGDRLSMRRLTGSRICEVLPGDWWASLNPGSEHGKEFSPWEIRELLLGDQGIQAVVQELLEVERQTTPTQVSFIGEAEQPLLFQSLQSFAEQESDIQALFILQEQNSTISEPPHFCIGVQSSAQTPARLSFLQGEISRLAHQATMGLVLGPSRVFVGKDPMTSHALALFRNVPPFFDRRAGGILSHVKRFFKTK